MTLSSPFEVVYDDLQGRIPDPQAITVAVSLFNYERYLTECLESVSKQSYSHIELIVVDDDSRRDSSLMAARTWIESNRTRFARSLLLRHSRNRGLAAARNTAFAQARTEHVFVLDADNSIHPHALSRLHAAISHQAYDAAYSQIELFGERHGLGSADVWSRLRLARGPYIDAMALVRRSAWSAVGGYDHIEWGWEDYDFWCKFADNGMAAVFVPEILCRYRTHSRSMTQETTMESLSQVMLHMMVRHPWLRLPA